MRLKFVRMMDYLFKKLKLSKTAQKIVLNQYLKSLKYGLILKEIK